MFLISKGSMMHPPVLVNLHRGRLRLALGAAFLPPAAGVPLAHATPSSAAGVYIHQSCVDGADLSDAYGGWSPHLYSILGNGNANQRPWGGLHSEMNPSAMIPFGSTVGWRYNAPSGTNIARFVTDYAGWTQPFAGGFQGIVQVLDGGGAIGLSYTDGGADPAHQRTLDWQGLTTNPITARTVCDGPTGQPGCIGSTAWSSFYYPKLYLADDAPPVAGTAAGSLTSDAALKGIEDLSYSATDQGGGVARFRLYVDGSATGVDHVIDTFNGHCQIKSSEAGSWVFAYPKP